MFLKQRDSENAEENKVFGKSGRMQKQEFRRNERILARGETTGIFWITNQAP